MKSLPRPQDDDEDDDEDDDNDEDDDMLCTLLFKDLCC